MSYQKSVKKLNFFSFYFFCENSNTLHSNGSSSRDLKARQVQMPSFRDGATEGQMHSQNPFHRVKKSSKTQ